MKKTSFLLLIAASMLAACSNKSDVFTADNVNELRAPAYPLVTIDPFTSAW
jgi:hypothetical protein